MPITGVFVHRLVSPKPLNNELGFLRAVYSELRGLGQIDYANSLELMKPFRIEERELSWPTSKQITVLLGAIRDGCDNPHVEPLHPDLFGDRSALV